MTMYQNISGSRYYTMSNDLFSITECCFPNWFPSMPCHFRNNTAKTLDLETCELPPYLVTDHKHKQMQMSEGSNYPFPKIPIPSLSSKYKVHFIKIKGNNYFSQIIYIVPVQCHATCKDLRSYSWTFC